MTDQRDPDQRDQDQPDLDAFAAAIGTDRLAEGDTSADDAQEERGGRDWRTPVSGALTGLAGGAKKLASKLGDVSDKVMPSSDDDVVDIASLRDRLRGARTSMVTTIDERGTLSSRPLTVQEVTDAGDVVFIVARDADWVTESIDAVNVALVDDGRTWVSVAGRAVVRDDRAELDERWSPLLDTFFPGGREQAVVFHVVADRWEYWQSPNRVSQAIEIVTSMVGDRTPDLGDSGTIET